VIQRSNEKTEDSTELTGSSKSLWRGRKPDLPISLISMTRSLGIHLLMSSVSLLSRNCWFSSFHSTPVHAPKYQTRNYTLRSIQNIWQDRIDDLRFNNKGINKVSYIPSAACPILGHIVLGVKKDGIQGNGGKGNGEGVMKRGRIR